MIIRTIAGATSSPSLQDDQALYLPELFDPWPLPLPPALPCPPDPTTNSTEGISTYIIYTYTFIHSTALILV